MLKQAKSSLPVPDNFDEILLVKAFKYFVKSFSIANILQYVS